MDAPQVDRVASESPQGGYRTGGRLTCDKLTTRCPQVRAVSSIGRAFGLHLPKSHPIKVNRPCSFLLNPATGNGFTPSFVPAQLLTITRDCPPSLIGVGTEFTTCRSSKDARAAPPVRPPSEAPASIQSAIDGYEGTRLPSPKFFPASFRVRNGQCVKFFGPRKRGLASLKGITEGDHDFNVDTLRVTDRTGASCWILFPEGDQGDHV